MTFIIAMFLVAVVLVIAEVMFPSFGMLGLLAAGAFLMAIMKAFELGNKQGVGAIVVAVILAPVAFALGVKLLQKTPLGDKFILKAPTHQEVKGKAADQSLAQYLGRTGKAISTLRPSGIVEFDNVRVDAISDGVFIDEGATIRVVCVEGNRLVVELTANNSN